MASSVTNDPASNPYSVVNGNTTSSGTAANSAQGIQDRFLKLLVTQLQAQDPMNPMDNSQMTSQMAQISQVSGMEKLNQTMQTMLSAQIASQSLMATTLVGRQVLSPGNVLNSAGDGATLSGAATLDADAKKMTVTIKNESGVTVNTIDVTSPAPKAGMNNFTWNGKDMAGNILPSGKYTFEVTATKADGTSAKTVAYTTQKVNAVAWDSSGIPQLILNDGTRAKLADIAQMS
ncbi:flagellar hook assembly protein FlgD [Paludibacterium paludis]|uniref:Basal-body rod modification protein FlgD n=1 Tax=Paludibacterium paludis TaxID=1225769 RepID=A0A918NYE8_9NEIS|nr:flagellar hook assembly protein FlgD [Paludibacterium paludis]GGY06677.1 basal-body rod modification protein FlgD [Paludibacterium paludis]